MQVGEKSYAQGDKNENVETNRLIGTKYTKLECTCRERHKLMKEIST